MKDFKDSLIVCPLCKGDACYKQPINEKYNSYFCFGCGYQTYDTQKVGEVPLELLEANLPELYKDLKRIDEEFRIWYPTAINDPEKGTVFLNVTPKGTCEWCAIKVRPLTEVESTQLANRSVKFKSDSTTLKFFQGNFIDALEYINFFN